ncbi:hypothetical protein FJZ26_02670, partial [Candidatus Parvarchaeota archaeon]|nr:hypothetical protein [Candidatus Parvarchaeota archaeon]
MKIGIVSDTHFGYKRWEQDAAAQAQAAMLDAADKCDLILMPGDIFDTRVPRLETLQQAIRIFKKTAGKKDWQAKCLTKPSSPPILGIHGTHELRGRDLVNPVQILETIGLISLVHNDPSIWELDGKRVAINGLGGVPDELAIAALETLNFTPQPNAFNIFMFHQSLQEYIKTDKKIMSFEDLPKGFDLYISGHMHKYTVDMDGKFLIPGSTVVTQLREEETRQKGYIIYDTQAKTHEFVPIKTRKFFFSRLEFDHATPNDVRQKAKEELARIAKLADGEKPIIKLKLHGTLAQGFVPQDVHVEQEGGFDSIIEIDNELDLQSLKDKIELIRLARAGKMSVMDFGMSILRKEATAGGYMGQGEWGIDEMFGKLSEENGNPYEKFASMERPQVSQVKQPAHLGVLGTTEGGEPGK